MAGDYDEDTLLERFDESAEMESLTDKKAIPETGIEAYKELKPHEIKESINDYMTAVRDNPHQRDLANRMYERVLSLMSEVYGLKPSVEYDRDWRGNIIRDDYGNPVILDSDWVSE